MTTKRRILTRSVREFLRAPRTARLATMGRDRYPHVVPIWFMLTGEDIVFGTTAGEQKVKNALRRRRATVLIGGDLTRDGAGYMIKGDLRVEEDPGLAISRRLIARYQRKKAAALLTGFAQDGVVILRLTPRSVIRVL